MKVLFSDYLTGRMSLKPDAVSYLRAHLTDANSKSRGAWPRTQIAFNLFISNTHSDFYSVFMPKSYLTSPPSFLSFLLLVVFPKVLQQIFFDCFHLRHTFNLHLDLKIKLLLFSVK